MASLDAVSANLPPVQVTAPVTAPAATASADNDNTPDTADLTQNDATVAPTNANENTPATYTALATESQSNIRGSGLDISA